MVKDNKVEGKDALIQDAVSLINALEKKLEELRGCISSVSDYDLSWMLSDTEFLGNEMVDGVAIGASGKEGCKCSIVLVGKMIMQIWIASEMLSRLGGGAGDFEKLVSEARARVASMDGVDGFQDRGLPTILAAMEDGLKNPESGSGFDAFVMLSDVVGRSKNSA